MRLCPSVEGSGSPLITHRIGVEVCLARQGSNFHKCHRCVYRGQPANWEPESPPLAMVTTRDAFEQRDIEVKTIEIPRAVKQPNKHPASVVRGKSAAKNASQAAS